ncbi:LacI family DNA-binding transcriptional regulator [Pseudonocardia sp. CA-107938]|uniref:LacI family DNA-binding transcriptional regulator n=1 Tax=Pseudonocardia sp. CA-107938 TaxID=3240021 RepID=UPI003D8DB084
MAATLRDVALAAGVSPSTVSRALSVPDMVKQSTRTRVESAVRQLGYQPNRAARGLITGRTGNIGLIVPDMSNPFFAAAAKGVQSAAGAAAHSVFIADTDEQADAEPGLLRALAPQVDGIVLCAPRSAPDVLDAAGDTPVVLFNQHVAGRPAVTVDAADGMRQGVAHLAALGHRRIAFVAGPQQSWAGGERERGLRLAADTAGVDVVHLGHFAPQFQGGVAAADLALASGATAVFAYNDLVALGLLNRFSVRGVSVPDEISVLGFDDIPMSSMIHPALSTIAVPTLDGGRAAVAILLSMIAGDTDDVPQRELPTQLLVRATTGVAPGSR